MSSKARRKLSGALLVMLIISMAFLCVLAGGVFFARAEGTLTSITVEVNPETRIYYDDTLDSLKGNSGDMVEKLIVTGYFNDDTSRRLAPDEYALSAEGLDGSAQLGTNSLTVTVTAGGDIENSVTFTPRGNDTVAIEAEYVGQEIYPYTFLWNEDFVVYGIRRDGSKGILEPGAYSLRYDLRATPDNASDPYVSEVEIIYPGDEFIQPCVVRVNVTKLEVTGISVPSIQDRQNVGADFDPTLFSATIFYSDGGSASTTCADSNFYYSYAFQNDEGEWIPIKVYDLDQHTMILNPDLTAEEIAEYEDKNGYGYFNGSDYIFVYYVESGKVVSTKVRIGIKTIPILPVSMIVQEDGSAFTVSDAPGLDISESKPLYYQYSVGENEAVTGIAQHFSIGGNTPFNANYMTVTVMDGGDDVTASCVQGETGAFSLTDAGIYTVTVALNPGYYWDIAGYSSLSEISYTVTVSPASLDNFLGVKIAGWTYGGYQAGSNAPVVTGNYGDAEVKYHFSGTQNDGSDYSKKVTAAAGTALSDAQVPSQAGDYTLYISVAESADGNFAESSMQAESAVPFEVSRAKVRTPVKGEDYTDLTYNAKPQSVTISATNIKDLVNVTCTPQTEADTYQFTVSLKDKYNYEWDTTVSEADTADKNLSWEIKQFTETAITALSVANWEYGSGPNDPVFEWTFKSELSSVMPQYTYYYDKNGDGTYSELLPAKPDATSPAGNYKLVALIAGNANYVEASKETTFVITRQGVAIPQITDSYTYSGEEITVSISPDFIGTYYEVVGNSNKGTDAGNYTLVLSLIGNYAWAEATDANGNDVTGDLSLSWRIMRKGVDKPQITGYDGEGGYIYNDGAEISAQYSGSEYLGTYYTASGEESGIDAGDYTLILTPTANYCWADDGDTAAYSLPWKIVPRKVAAPTADGSTFTFDGSGKTYVFGGFDGKAMQISVIVEEDGDNDGLDTSVIGQVTALHAGTYTITVSLKSSQNYAWSDAGASERTYTFVIGRMGVERPQITGYPEGESGYIYKDGEPIFAQYSGSENLGTYYTASGEESGIDAGNYSLTLTLESDYQWTDGGTGTFDLDWSIVARKIAKPTISSDDNVYTDETLTAIISGIDANAEKSLKISSSCDEGDAKEFSLSAIEGTQITVSALHAGTYTVTFTLNNAGVVNYVWSDGEGTAALTLKWTIGKAQSAIKDNTVTVADVTFGTAPAAPDFAANFGKDSADITYYYKKTKDGTYSALGEAPDATSPAGYYKVEVYIPAGDDWEQSAVAEDEFLIDRLAVAVPKIEGEYTYNKSPQTVRFTTDGVEKGYFTVEGGSQTDAGSYTVTLTLADNYKWEGDENGYDEQSRSYVFSTESGNAWVILQRQVSRISLTENTKVSDVSVPGTPEPQSNEIISFDETYGAEAYVFSALSDGLTKSESGKAFTATNAGTYTVTVGLTANYTWATEGEDSFVLTWTIGKKEVEIPSGVTRRLEFNGSELYPEAIYDSGTGNAYYGRAAQPFWKYGEGGNTPVASTTDKGAYYLSFELYGPLNFCWKINESDKGTEEWMCDYTDGENGKTLYVWYEITAKQYDKFVTVTVENITYGQSVQPQLTLKMEADPNLSEVQEAIAADSSDKNTIAYYYSGTTLGGETYGGTGSGIEVAPTAAGTYYLVVVIEETTNYARTYIGSGENKITFTIAPAQLTPNFVGASDGGYSYEYGNSKNVSVTFTGYQHGEGAGNVLVTCEYKSKSTSVTRDDASMLPVGDYTVTASISNCNYYISKVEGKYVLSVSKNYEVTKKDLTVTVTGQSVVYGEALKDWVACLSAEGWVNGEKNSLESDYFTLLAREGVVCAYEQGSDVGTYKVTLQDPTSPLEAGMGNYNIIYKDYDDNGAVVSVSKRKITVTIADKSSIYGGEIAAFTAANAFTGGQTVPGDVIFGDAAYTLEARDFATGEEPVTLSTKSAARQYRIVGVPTAEGQKNYEIDFVGSKGTYAVYTIKKADIAVGDADYSAVYSGAAQKDLIRAKLDDVTTIVNAELGQNVTWTFSLTDGGAYGDLGDFKDVTKNAGKDGAVTVYYKVTADNHNDKTGSFTVTISRADLRVSVQDAVVDYGFAVDESKFVLVYDGFKGSDNAEKFVNAENVTYSMLSGDAAYAAGAAAGSEFVVKPSGITSDNYNVIFDSTGTLVVAPRKITVTLRAQTAVYEGQDHTYTLGGVYGENYTAVWGGVTAQEGKTNVTSFTGSEGALYDSTDPSLQLAAELTSHDVGSYKIFMQSADNENYAVTVENAENILFTITAKPITVSITDGEREYTYGETVSHRFDYTGQLCGEDTVSVTLTYTGTGEYDSTTAPRNAGSYRVTLTISGNANYVLKAATYADFTISPKALTITADDKQTYYGEAAPAFTATLDGLASAYESADRGLIEGLLVGKFSCAYTVGDDINDGIDILITDQEGIKAGAGNYEIEFVGGKLVVNARPIIVVIDDQTTVYGEATAQLTADVSKEIGEGIYGVYGEDKNIWSLSVKNGDAALDEKTSVGTYDIVGAIEDTNYAVTFRGKSGGEHGVYKITPKKVTISFDEPDLTYSGTAKNITATIKDLMSWDSVLQPSLSYSGNTFSDGAHVGTGAPVKAGRYTVRASLLSNNYYIEWNAEDGYIRYDDHEFTVQKKELTITVSVGTTKIEYGHDAPSSSYTYEIGGFVNSETETVLSGGIVYKTAYQPGATFGSAGRSYAVTHDTEDGEAFASNNYSFAVTDGEFEVVARETAITISFADIGEKNTYIYGQTQAAVAAALDLFGSDDMQFVYTYTGRNGTEYADDADNRADYPTWAGEYTVTVSSNNTNYELIGTLSADYTIAQKQVKVTAENKEVTYGEDAPAFTVSYAQGDFAYGENENTIEFTDTPDYVCTYEKGAEKGSVREYDIEVSGLSSRNYTFVYTKGTLTVTKRAIEVTISDDESVYGESVDLYALAKVTSSIILADGDTLKDVVLFVTYNAKGSSQEIKNAGTYYIAGKANEESAGKNYEITFKASYQVPSAGGVAAKYVVGQKAVWIDFTLPQGDDSLFNGGQKSVTVEINKEDIVGEDNIQIIPYYEGIDGTVYAKTDVAPTDAGSYEVTFTADDSNYTAASFSTTLKITPCTVEIIWLEQEFTYNGTVQTVTASYAPWVNGEKVTDGGQFIQLAVSVISYNNGTAQEFKNAGAYVFEATFEGTDNAKGNYVLPSNATRSYVIGKYAIKVTILSASSEYGDPIAQLKVKEGAETVFECDRVGGEFWWTNVFTLSTNAVQGSVVGNYTIEGTATSGAGENYAITFTNEAGNSTVAQYRVEKRVLIVSVDGFEVVYGESVDNGSIKLLYARKNGDGTAFYNDETDSVVNKSGIGFACDYTACQTNAGTRVGVTVSGLSADNYAFEYTDNEYATSDAADGGFTVIKRTVSVENSFIGRLTGLIYNATNRWSEITAEDLGGFGLAKGESVGDQLKFVYAFTYNESEFIYDAASNPIKNAGAYTVTVTIDDTSSNYVLDKAYILPFEIAKKALTVTADGNKADEEQQDISVVYGDPLTNATIIDDYLRYDGFVPGEDELSTGIRRGITVSHDYVSAKEGRTDAGSRLAVRLTVPSAINYEITPVDGNISVQKRLIQLSADGKQYCGYYNGAYGTYGGEINRMIALVSGLMDDDDLAEEISFSYHYAGTANDGVNTLDRTFTGDDFFTAEELKDIHAGTYTVTVTITSTNYAVQNGTTDVSQEFSWWILKQRVASPRWLTSSFPASGAVQENKIEGYNIALYLYKDAGGDDNTPSYISNDEGTQTVTMRATYAGSYWAEFELINGDDYVWEAQTGTGYDEATLRVYWTISKYRNLQVTITGMQLNGEPIGIVMGEDTNQWFAHSWTYGDTFGTFLATASYNDGIPFTGTIRFSVWYKNGENSYESVTNYLNAGTYYVKAVIDGSADYEYTESTAVFFTISKKEIEVPTLDGNSVYKHGADVTSDISGYDQTVMYISGSNVTVDSDEEGYYISAVNAGSYFIRITLSDTRNYKWRDGLAESVRTLTWKVSPFEVKAPVFDSGFETEYCAAVVKLDYTDSEHKQYYMVTGDLSATNAGEYEAVAVLKNKSNYIWQSDTAENGTSNDIVVTWTIRQAANSWKEGKDTYTRAGWVFGEDATEEILPEAKFGEVVVWYYLDESYSQPYLDAFFKTTPAGTYYVVVEVAATDNYEGLTGDLAIRSSFTIGKAANGWIGAYAREGWIYGSSASAETLPTAKFGTVTVAYYTDEKRTALYQGNFDNETDAGTYYVLLTVDGTDNYEALRDETKSFTVSKAIAYAVWDESQNLIYDGQPKTVGATYLNVNGEQTSLAVRVVSYGGEAGERDILHAGTYELEASFASGEGDNYDLQNVVHTITVEAKTIVIDILPQTAVYSGAIPVLSQEEGVAYSIETAEGVVGDDDLGILLTLANAGADVGVYSITGTWDNSDYNVVFTGDKNMFTVTALEITITFSDIMGGTYGNVVPASATAHKYDGGEAVDVSVGLFYAGTPNGGNYTEYGTEIPVDAGSYTVTAYVESGNYSIVGLNSAVFNIAKAGIEVKRIEAKKFNNALQTADVEFTNDVPDEVYNVINEGGINAGLYDVILTLNTGYENNYTWVYNGLAVDSPSMTLTFTIIAAETEDNTVIVEIGDFEGWTFGEEAIMPEASADFGTPVFYYSDARDGTYTPTVPQHAGTYWLKAVVPETTNNAESSSEPVQFTIAQAKVAAPTFDGGYASVYDASAQVRYFVGYDRSKMAIVSNDGALISDDGKYAIRATDAGEYRVVFRLIYQDDYRDYVWAESDTDEVGIVWTIAKAPNAWLEGKDSYQREGWKQGESATAATLPAAQFGNVTVTYYTDQACTIKYEGSFDGNTPAGTYYVVVEVAATDNYEGLTGQNAITASFTVEAAEEASDLIVPIVILACLMVVEIVFLVCLIRKRNTEKE